MKIDPLGNQISPVLTTWTLVPREDEPRSPGLHQSNISSRMMIELGHYDDRAADRDRMQVGLVMEAMIEGGLREIHLYNPHYRWKVSRPGEFLIPSDVGNIAVTPDGYDPGEGAVHEMKASWYSAVKPITDISFWPWHIQMKLGCLALETLTAYLHAFWVNGDYRPPCPWPIHSYRFTFTPTELQENVEMLANFVRDRKHLFPEIA